MTLIELLPSLIATAAPDVATGEGNFWLPPAASTYADRIDWVFYLIYWVCVFFFVLIVALMVWFAYKYRRVPGRRSEVSPTHNTPLELTWTIIPLILVIAIFWIGLDGYVDYTRAPKNAYEVDVTAQRWVWTFQHRNGAVDTRWLKVPEDTPIKLTMNSTDVLHSLFVPAFRAKQDVVPGRYTTLWFEAAEPGIYQLFCTEYCGTQHAQMGAFVKVLPKDQFEREITEDANWIDDVPNEPVPLAQAGHRLYARCASCHSLKKGERLTGPSFWEAHEAWGQTHLMEDGREVVVDENYVRKSILNPQADIRATYPRTMPTFQGQLGEKELLALIRFIERLDEVVDEQGDRLE